MKKLAAKKKQLKAEGKGNRPNRADPLNKNQIEKLWTTGAAGMDTPPVTQSCLVEQHKISGHESMPRAPQLQTARLQKLRKLL